MPKAKFKYTIAAMNVRLPTREEIHTAYTQGEEAVVGLFAQLGVQFEALAGELEKQAQALKDLQARSRKNSRNSDKPPSSDGYGKSNRTESLRGKSTKPNGGQKGHRGHTLEATTNPDHSEDHGVEQCEGCGSSLADVQVSAHEERQVYDIPAIRIEVTAHRAEIKICPACGAKNRGEFPEGVVAPVQYGLGVKTWAAYFPSQHYVSVERTAGIFEDLLKHRICEAVVLNASKELGERIEPAREAVKEQLRQAEVMNLDESGMRVEGKLHWLHVASTARLTDYEIHAKRGQEAMEAAGILPHFKGRAVHDHWKPYWRYRDCSHSLCNAHHLRELQHIEKQYEQSWAGEMAKLLCKIKEAVEEARPEADCLAPQRLEQFEQDYDRIVTAGYEANPRAPPEEHESTPKKRGRCKQTPPRNLLDRLRDFKPQVLAFMYDFRVPFDNNLAERDVRMVKVKQKVSGGFRTHEGASNFAHIRGYLSTARKNTVNVFAGIRDAFGGKPFIPSSETP